MKDLVLAEKPSVAKELARVLKCGLQRKGFFEGAEYLVTWALGHLVTLAEPEDYEVKYKEWRLADLPMLPEPMRLKLLPKTSFQYRIVADLMRRQDVRELVIATDAGREGELVARWIMKLSGFRKPFRRLWISSQTDKAIKDGFRQLRKGSDYDNLFHAAACRAEADWLIGLNVTRALTCKFEFPLNAGRVQTPTLSILATRDEEIKHFKPVSYWSIIAEFDDYSGLWRDENGNSRIFELARADHIVTGLKDQKAVIEEMTLKPKTENPPLAYDLTELQRDANQMYGFSAKLTLSLTQSLYERHKLVTYPRTDSRHIPSDMVAALPGILRALADGPFARFVKPLLEKPLQPGKHFVDDSKVSDHYAIIPTEQSPALQALSGEERRIYDLVVKRFITVLYPPCRLENITIVTAIGRERFYARGRIIKEEGWRTVTPAAPRREGEQEEALPEQRLQQQSKGAVKTVKRIKLNKAQTEPPARYTEATLLTAMESPGKFIEDEILRESIKDGGLGTVATRAEIIEKLIGNDYVERQGHRLIPTSKARQLINLVPPQLKSPELTAQWELRLANIAKGRETPGSFMADIRRNAKELVEKVKTEKAEFKLDNLTKHRCPQCGGFMMSVQGKRGKMLKCSERGCGFTQSEDGAGQYEHKSGPREHRMNQNLIRQYSDNKRGSFTLGEMLKAAQKNEDPPREPANDPEQAGA